MLQNRARNAVLGARAFGSIFSAVGFFGMSGCCSIHRLFSGGKDRALPLLTKPDESVAVFWPAAGSSRPVRNNLLWFAQSHAWPVIAGVVAATIAANLLGDRNILSAIVFAVCNAFEAVLVAGLIERYFGLPLRLDALRRVLGFVTAAVVGCAVSGVGGTIGYLFFRQSSSSAP